MSTARTVGEILDQETMAFLAAGIIAAPNAHAMTRVQRNAAGTQMERRAHAVAMRRIYEHSAH